MTISTAENIKLDNGLFEKKTREENIFLKIEKTRTQNMYIVTVVLPCYVRYSNIQSFNVSDNVETVKRRIKKNMQSKFGTTDLSSFVVKSIECNANKEISQKVDIDMVTELMYRALLSPNKPIMSYVRGEQANDTRFIKKPIMDGFKTQRNTCGRFSVKAYNKGREMKVNRKLFRLELLYNSRGIKQALGLKRSVTLSDVLQRKNLQKIINRYIKDVQDSICPCVQLYKEDAENLVQKKLQAGYKPYKVFIEHYDILQYDYCFFQRALEKHYDLEKKSKQSAILMTSRIKTKAKAEGKKICQGTFRELEDFFEKIGSQKIEVY